MRVSNISEIERLIEEKLISKTKHPDCDLWILNYMQKCQFAGTWTVETRMCRGLIVDSEWNVKARPFVKFFNLGQHEAFSGLPELPWDRGYTIAEKMDGSLGILYWIADQPYIATRGSFTSDQALRGTEILRRMISELPEDVSFSPLLTYLFEIVYPENRIVVDYHGEEKLVLLAVIETETGKELELCVRYPHQPKFYPANTPLEVLQSLLLNDGSAEGVVIRFADGQRVKLKTDEYVRLHRLLTGVSNKSIWELLKAGSPLDEIIEKVPDEFYEWVKQVKEELEVKHSAVMQEAAALAVKVQGMVRKDAAAIILKEDRTVSAAAFALMDGKQSHAEQAVWRALQPAFERPFMKDLDL